MLPELTYDSSTISNAPEGLKTFLFDFEAGDFVLSYGRSVTVDGAAAVKQWVYSTLHTEKYRYLIYKNHGIELESILERQSTHKLFVMEVERALREALEVHDQIKSVSDFGFERLKNGLKATFSVNLTDGTTFGGETIV